MQISIGTRGSPLALIQAKMVEDKLTALGHKCELVIITTTGDKEKTKPLYDIGGKALFLKEIEEALVRGEVDIAMHSLKDMPGILPEGLEIGAMLEREDPRDALLCKVAKTIAELPHGATVGSSSPRRMLYLKQMRPDLNLVNLRGNMDTRYNKVTSGELDATIVAYAGMKRLGGKYLDEGFCTPISPKEMIPAIGQGVVAVEVRSNDSKMKQICAAINHKATWDLAQAERSFLAAIDAGCRSPVAAYAYPFEDNMKVDFMLANDEGTKIANYSGTCHIAEAYEFGQVVAEKLRKDLLL